MIFYTYPSIFIPSSLCLFYPTQSINLLFLYLPTYVSDNSFTFISNCLSIYQSICLTIYLCDKVYQEGPLEPEGAGLHKL